MDEYEDLLRLHLANLPRTRLQLMAKMITAELNKRAGIEGGDELLGGKAKDEGPACPYEVIVATYHRCLPGLAQVRMMSDTRKGAMRRFWTWVLTSKKSDNTRRAETLDQGIEWIEAYFQRAADNDFLMGRGNRTGWKADLDFLLTERGRKHVIEKTAVAA